MSRGLAWQPAIALAAMLLLGGAIAWTVLAELPEVPSPIPGHTGKPFEPLSAAMPEIARFEAFSVNNDNPFVPWRERALEAKRLSEPKTVVLKPRPPPVIKPVEKPKLVLPTKTAPKASSPVVQGITRRSDGTTAVVVAIPGEGRSRVMKPGETASGWTLVSVESSSIAVFTDASGRTYRLVVGER